MKANELRIKNFIGSDGNILIVEKIDIQNNIGCSLFKKSEGQQVNSGNKYPIPLTEEWLLNFGFKKFKGNNTDFFLDDFESSCNMSIWFWKGTRIKINYVHQLQNLYFALTGQELILQNK